MGKYTSKDNVPAIVFKRNNPSLYEKIMELYSPVFDAATAIELYINNIPPPRCSICNVRLQVNKHKPTRCKKHVNVKSLYKYEDLSNKNKLSIEFFEGYKNSSEKISLHCEIHGKYDQVIKSYLKNHGCQKCYFVSKKGILLTTWDNYKERFLNMHGDTYDYSHSIYNGATEKINIRCKKHGEFNQIANVHAAGSGCPKCANEENSVRQSTEESVMIKRIIMANRIKSRSQKTKNSKLELKFKEFLSKNNLMYEHQYIIYDINYTGAWTYDFYIPSLNLLVEMDGEYWHRKPETLNRDIIKNKLAEKNGKSLVRISDSDIKHDIIFESKDHILKHTEKIMHERINYIKEKYGTIIGQTKNI